LFKFPNGTVVGDLITYDMLRNQKFRQLYEIEKYLKKGKPKWEKLQKHKAVVEAAKVASDKL